MDRRVGCFLLSFIHEWDSRPKFSYSFFRKICSLYSWDIFFKHPKLIYHYIWFQDIPTYFLVQRFQFIKNQY